MRIELRDIAKGRAGQALPSTSLAYETGVAVLAVAETEQRPTVLGLIASGRMAPDAGSVAVDGETDAAAVRRAVALVDAPDVCDPAPNVTVAGVAAEELMFAGRPSNPISARRWLDAAGFGALARTPIADVSPRERLALLLGLTALRPGVTGMVLVSPDRHGGRPEEWWELAESFAAQGFAVLVVAGEASAAVLGARAVRAEVGVAADGPADADPAPEPQRDSEPEPAPEPVPAPEPEPVPEPVPAPEREPDPGLQPDTETEATPAPDPEPDVEPLSDREPEATVADPEASPDTEASADPEASDPEASAASEPDEEDAR